MSPRDPTTRPGDADVELAPEPIDPSLNLVTVAERLSVTEAELTQTILRQAGIDSVLSDLNTIWANWFLMNALGGVKVRVAARDVAAALEVLEQPASAFPVLEPDSDPPIDETPTPAGSPRCPRCGSRADPAPDPAPKGVLVEVVQHLVPLPTPHQRWICRECGKRWIESGSMPVERRAE